MTCTHFCLSFTLLLSGNAALAQRVPIAQQLVFTPYRSTGIYEVGETVGWTVGPGRVTPTYAYKWTIRRNNAVVLKEGKLDLSSGKDKIEITGDQPEMIYVAGIRMSAKPPVIAPALIASAGRPRFCFQLPGEADLERFSNPA